MSLANELRQMTGVSPTQYAIGAVTYWTDVQLTELLAANREQLIRAPVQSLPNADRTVTMARVAGNGTFDAEAASGLVSRAGVLMAGWTLDRHGVLTFAGNVAADEPAEFTGWTYDLHAAAADVLTAWAAAVSQHYDVSVDGTSMTRSQKYKQLADLAASHRAQALPTSIPLVGDRSIRSGRYDSFDYPAFSRFP